MCLLRGVNVGGKRVAMKDLRELVEGLGHEDVATYIQSGNVVFRAKSGGAKKLAGDIQKAIRKEMGLDVTVLLRSPDELARGDRRQTRSPASRTSSTSRSSTPNLTRRRWRQSITTPTRRTRSRSSGREVYLHCPDGYGDSKLINSFWEKKLGVAATTRNWRTVNKLLEMASD